MLTPNLSQKTGSEGTVIFAGRIKLQAIWVPRNTNRHGIRNINADRATSLSSSAHHFDLVFRDGHADLLCGFKDDIADIICGLRRVRALHRLLVYGVLKLIIRIIGWDDLYSEIYDRDDDKKSYCELYFIHGRLRAAHPPNVLDNRESSGITCAMLALLISECRERKALGGIFGNIARR